MRLERLFSPAARIFGAALVAAVVMAPAPGGAASHGWATLALARAGAEQASVAHLYAGREQVVSQYALAMQRYRTAAARSERDRLSIALMPRQVSPVLEPFTWVADNGDTVRRVEDGVFALALGNPLGNWYTEIRCRVIEWPRLYCDDGRERPMSAPDLSTMIFDGVAYHRPYPSSQ